MLPILVIAAIYIVAMIACGRVDYNARQTMVVADSLMETDPDSSLTLLMSINPHEVDTRWDDANRALYGLLLTQAAVKSDSSHLLDSARIAFAVQWFDSHGSKFNRLRSLFYLSYVDNQLGNIQETMAHASHAHDLSLDYCDDYWIGKTSELLSRILADGFLREDALEYSKKAAESYKKSGHDDYYRWSLCDVAADYANVDSLDKALEIWSDIADKSMNVVKDTFQAAFCREQIFLTLAEHNRLTAAEARLKDYEDIIEYSTPSSEFFSRKAQTLAYRLGESEFKALLDSANARLVYPTERLAVYDAMTMRCIAKGDWGKALSYRDSILWAQNRSVRNLLKQSVVKGQQQYINSQMEADRLTHQQWMLKIYWGVSLIVIIAIIAVWILVFLVRRRKDELERKIIEILEMTEDMGRLREESLSAAKTIEKRDDQIHRTQKMMVSLFNERWKVLNALCNQYFEKGDVPGIRNTIIKDFEHEISKIILPESQNAIEESINDCYNNLMVRLREECKFLSERDIRFVMYNFAGLSPKAICLFENIKLKNFYMRRSRIAKRISESGAKDSDEFVIMMSLKRDCGKQ